MTDTQAPKAASAAAGSAKASELELLTETGEKTGVVVRLGAVDADPDADETTRAASAITGWTGLTVDGHSVRYSGHQAKALLARFPHLAAQVAKAVKA